MKFCNEKEENSSLDALRAIWTRPLGHINLIFNKALLLHVLFMTSNLPISVGTFATGRVIEPTLASYQCLCMGMDAKGSAGEGSSITRGRKEWT